MKLWLLAATGALALLVTACQKNAQPTVKEEAPPPQTETPGAQPPVADPYASDALVAPRGAGSDTSVAPTKPLPPEAKGGRTYVVQKGDTLYKIARQAYGDERRWKEIWNANRTRVPNKDRLEVGTKLIIP